MTIFHLFRSWRHNQMIYFQTSKPTNNRRVIIFVLYKTYLAHCFYATLQKRHGSTMCKHAQSPNNFTWIKSIVRSLFIRRTPQMFNSKVCWLLIPFMRNEHRTANLLGQKCLQRSIHNWESEKKNNASPYHTKFCCFSIIHKFISFPIFPSCHAKICIRCCLGSVWRTALSHLMLWQWRCCGGASCFEFLVQHRFLISMVSY